MKDLEILEFLKVLQTNKDSILEKVSATGANTEFYIDGLHFQTDSSICGNMWNTLSFSHDFNTEYYESWEYYSEEDAYPVGGGEVYNSLENYWVGEQGELRFDLIDHLVECYSEQLKGDK